MELRCFCQLTEEYMCEASTSLFFDTPLKIGPIGCSYTSVNNYQHKQYNILEERMSELQGGQSLKSRIYF